MSTALSKVEQGQLARYESTLQTALAQMERSFRVAAEALAAIRDGQLWRGVYACFDAYCEERWGFSGRRAYQLMAAEKAVKALPEDLRTIVHSESQARALAAVPEDDRPAVLEKAAQNGKPTAARITRAAKEATQELEMDQTGMVIPDTLLPLWHEADQVGRELSALASKLKVAVEKGLTDSPRVFGEVTNSLTAKLEDCYWQLKCIIPHAVCPTCSGHKPKDCTHCKGRGWLSKYLYENTTAKEIKALRERKKR